MIVLNSLVVLFFVASVLVLSDCKNWKVWKK